MEEGGGEWGKEEEESALGGEEVGKELDEEMQFKFLKLFHVQLLAIIHSVSRTIPTPTPQERGNVCW